MYLLYADESGSTGTDLDNPQQKIFTLAGLAVRDEDWYDLNNNIQKVKENINSQLVSYEIHAAEIFQGSKNKKKGFNFRKNSLETNLCILEKLVDLVVDLNLPIFFVMIDKSKFKKYITNTLGSSIKVDPYLYAFSFLSIEYNNFLISKKQNGMILLDEIQDIVGSLEILYSRLIGANFNGSTNNIIENALFLESNKNNFIQLADLCNFYINKKNLIDRYGNLNNVLKNKHCLDMYKKIEHLIINCKHFDIINNVNHFCS